MPRSRLARLPGLLAGLILFGAAVAVMAQAGLGLGPWEAFHQGISRQTGLALGTVSILVGVPVLALWWPIGVRPGIGTLLNIALVGMTTNVALPLLPAPSGLPVRLAMMLAGVLGIGIASGIYLAADLGPGPRDGLMTGLHHRFGWPIFAVRTTIEVSVLAIGWWLGGTVGLGTLVFAFGIGSVVQWALGIFDHRGAVLRRAVDLDAAE
ncbi:MAG TPA: hypothetical protein VL049_08270 [Candidatus Dormibacteraeota bacterium]|nr:hypothetical protein [Candidatus Dormibacteraeota bacterium]